jgi:hypothetical protein
MYEALEYLAWIFAAVILGTLTGRLLFPRNRR